MGCEVDQPRCDTQWPDSDFYNDQIKSLQPYTFSALVWDQAERDLKCNHVKTYPCMQQELVRSWRKAFNSPDAAFVVVQLPDYFDPKDPGAPGVPGFSSTAEGVFSMRLAQEQGVKDVEKTAATVTYDQSCNNLEFPGSCPFGSVHNIHKQHVGERVAAQLFRLMHDKDLVTEGPRAQKATAARAGNALGYAVSVQFAGGSLPFYLHPTRNCTGCCSTAVQGDFDVSHDGKSWYPGSKASMSGKDAVVFHADVQSPPAFVRYTAGSNFTQCALYNAQALPAWPFQMKVSSSGEEIVV